jgi:RNA polymerase sigma-70 factor (ECF subfamily)
VLFFLYFRALLGKPKQLNPISKQEEKELLIRLIEGDNDAFEKIYYYYVERVYYFAFRYMKNAEDTEEIVQEVFTRIWENRRNINTELSFSGYLLTTTKNTIFNNHRKKVNHQSYCSYIINYLQKNVQNVEDEIIYNDLMDLLHRTIAELPPKRQEIFKLSRFQGLPYKEISERLSISEKTIETHMRLALRDIKNVIEPVLEKIIS